MQWTQNLHGLLDSEHRLFGEDLHSLFDSEVGFFGGGFSALISCFHWIDHFFSFAMIDHLGIRGTVVLDTLLKHSIEGHNFIIMGVNSINWFTMMSPWSNRIKDQFSCVNQFMPCVFWVSISGLNSCHCDYKMDYTFPGHHRQPTWLHQFTLHWQEFSLNHFFVTQGTTMNTQLHEVCINSMSQLNLARLFYPLNTPALNPGTGI